MAGRASRFSGGLDPAASEQTVREGYPPDRGATSVASPPLGHGGALLTWVSLGGTGGQAVHVMEVAGAGARKVLAR